VRRPTSISLHTYFYSRLMLAKIRTFAHFPSTSAPDLTVTHPSRGQMSGGAIEREFVTRGFNISKYTEGDSDVISFHIYASWFSPPSCG